MERNRLETALRCLELALHPAAQDAEVIAAVNGFRRTADGVPLRQLCAQLAGAGSAPQRPAPNIAQLMRENLDLRRRLELYENDRAVSLQRCQEAEQRIRELREEVLDAERRVAAAEQRLGDVLAAQTYRTPPSFDRVLRAARLRGDHAPAAFPPAGERPAALDGAWTA